MGVEGCGLGAAVPEVALNDAKIDAVFEQMGRVGMAKRMNRSLLAYRALLDGSSQAGLEAGACDMVCALLGDAVLGSVLQRCGEEPIG